MLSLEMSAVSVGYRGRSVLEGVDFQLEEGQVCGVIGPNGSGKSSLLKAVIGLGVETRGAIRICGRDQGSMTGIEKARLIAFLPQEYNHASRLTALETVLLGRHPHRAAWEGDSEEDLAIAMESMEAAGVESLSGRPFAELSGGERRLVMLASVLAQEPRILLLDEPGSSLDFRHQADLWLLIDRLSSRGITVLASTHELNTALGFLDRVLVIGKGRQEAFGEPSETLTAQLLGRVFGVALTVTGDGRGGWLVLPSPAVTR
jgi:iron complex transport system ATP-binding protein